MDDEAPDALDRYWMAQNDEFRCGPIRKLARRDQVLRLVWLADAEICNGGFQQLFGNSTGKDVRLMAGAFAEIGATAAAELIASAVETLGSVFPLSIQSVRLWRLDRLTDAEHDHLDALADRYYAVAESIHDQLSDYLFGPAADDTGARP